MSFNDKLDKLISDVKKARNARATDPKAKVPELSCHENS